MDQSTHFEAFLQDPTFEEKYKELVLHAQLYANKRTWCGLFGCLEGEAKFSATDVVDGLICKIMTATPDKRARHFNNRYTLMAQFKGMIESEIHNLIRKKSNARSPVTTATNDAGEIVEIDPIASAPDSADTPDSTSMLAEERELKEQLLLELIDYVKDPALVSIIEGTIDGKSRAQMAKAAGISVEQFDADKKRLARKLQEFAAAKKKARKF